MLKNIKNIAIRLKLLKQYSILKLTAKLLKKWWNLLKSLKNESIGKISKSSWKRLEIISKSLEDNHSQNVERYRKILKVIEKH